jgi:hypothetical protein
MSTTPRVRVEATEDGLISAGASARWIRLGEAEALCTGIRDSAGRLERPRLLMDLGSLSRATPSAGFYALRQLGQFPVERIALVGANPFMRAFAAIVLKLGRFPEARFFADRAAAGAWLMEGRGPVQS